MKEKIIRKLILWLTDRANYITTATWISETGDLENEDTTFLIQVIALYPESKNPNFYIMDADFML